MLNFLGAKGGWTRLRGGSTLFVVLVVGTVGVCLAAAGAASATADAGQDADGTLVVDPDDGSAETYDTIQRAVDDAADGENVVVRPGTYREELTIDGDVTLRAPGGATLDGSTLGPSARAITIPDDAAPRVTGFTVVDYASGLHASGSTGDWHLENTSVVDSSSVAVNARHSEGDLRIEGVRIENRTAPDVDGPGLSDPSFVAGHSQGAWVVEDTTIVNAGPRIGVAAAQSNGPWTIRNTTIRGSGIGVTTYAASGEWTITGAEIVDGGTAVFAQNTTAAAWSIRESTIANNGKDTGYGVSGVDARDAVYRGDATGNWWGQPGGPRDGQCAGNVDCGAPRDDPAGGEAGHADSHFEVSAVDAGEASPDDGESTTVTAEITNTGTETDAQTVAFRVDGDVVATETVTLDDGESTTVAFDDVDAESLDGENASYGVYTLDDERSGELAEGDDDGGGDSDDDPADDGMPGFTAGALVVALLVLAAILGKRLD